MKRKSFIDEGKIYFAPIAKRSGIQETRKRDKHKLTYHVNSSFSDQFPDSK